MNLETAIPEKVHFLSSEQQKKVLNFIETLPKKKLRFLQFGHSISNNFTIRKRTCRWI